MIVAIDKDEQELQTLPISLSFTCLIIEEGSATKDSALPVNVEFDYGGPVFGGDRAAFTLTLEKGKQARFRVTTAPYDRRWTVRLVPAVAPVEIAAAEPEEAA